MPMHVQKLQATAKALTDKYPGIETQIVVADFSRGVDSGLYETIEGELDGLDIGVLVNNVGMSYPSALYFHELESTEGTEELTRNMVHLNVVAITEMSRIVVQGMVCIVV
jgi:17beta-estradiol 17-dehydrogenase / very-long-chain 3-oxoacyl-CoA reductase